ncbi:uncharacterized protein VTP21DRAFT_968 [Calcarisporiella thermophila]|uniref:uncharacterized protein n=1 Tax=Calcarisporiella thermophila TaxID=911321 RepID=UPI003741FD27
MPISIIALPALSQPGGGGLGRRTGVALGREGRAFGSGGGRDAQVAESGFGIEASSALGLLENSSMPFSSVQARLLNQQTCHIPPALYIQLLTRRTSRHRSGIESTSHTPPPILTAEDAEIGMVFFPVRPN